MSHKFWFTLGVLAIVAGIALGLYVGLWVCLAGGIIQIIEACKQADISATAIAFGVVRIVCAALAGWLTAIFCWFISAVCFGAAESAKFKKHGYLKRPRF